MSVKKQMDLAIENFVNRTCQLAFDLAMSAATEALAAMPLPLGKTEKKAVKIAKTARKRAEKDAKQIVKTIEKTAAKHTKKAKKAGKTRAKEVKKAVKKQQKANDKAVKNLVKRAKIEAKPIRKVDDEAYTAGPSDPNVSATLEKK